MTYDRVCFARHGLTIDGAVVSHSAELVRGNYPSCRSDGPLIRPSCRRRVFDTTGAFSPRGEGIPSLLKEKQASVAGLAAQFAFHCRPHRLATG